MEDLNAAVPNDKSLSRCISSSGVEKAISTAEAKIEWLKAPENAGKEPPKQDEVLRAWAMKNVVRQSPKTAMGSGLVDGPSLVKYPGWVFPEPDIKSDAVFSEYCDLLALYANWYPQGHFRLTLKRPEMLAKIGKQGLKKPTVFDGMESPLWVQRDNRDHNWGKTGGGLREALFSIEWADIDQSKWECVEIDSKYQAVLEAAQKEEANRVDPSKPAPGAKDKATIAEHGKEQLEASQKTQAAQTKEDSAATAASAPGGSAHSSSTTSAGVTAPAGGAKADDAVVAEPAEPVTVPFAMDGEPHTLVADPSKDRIDFNSLTPGELLKKILSVLGLAPAEGAGDLRAAQEKGKQADESNKNPDLKPGAKKSLRVVAAQKLKVALQAVIASLSAAAAKLKWKDASKQAVEDAAREKQKEKREDGDGAKADGAKADGAKADGPKADGPKADGRDGAKADGAKADAAKADAAKADGAKADGAKADGAKAEGAKAEGAKAEGAKADGAKAEGAQVDGAKADGAKADGANTAAAAKPTKPDAGTIKVEPKTVALSKASVTLSFDGHQVMVDPPGGALGSAIAAIKTIVSPDSHKALDAAAARADAAAARVQPKETELFDGTAVSAKLAADLEAIAQSLVAAQIAGLRASDLQKEPPALKTPKEAMDAFYKHRSWEELKKLYWEKEPRDEASMWQLFHARKAWVDKRINDICDANKCDKQDFGSAKATSDYDISVKVREKAVPESLQAKRPRQGDKAAPQAADSAPAIADSSAPAGGPPEKQQLDAEVQKAAQAAAKKNASIDPLPPAPAETPGVNKVISAFNKAVADEFGVQPGIVFDTNIYDGGETVPAALNEAPALQTEAGKEADLQVQDAAAMSKVRRYLTDDGDNAQSDYTSKTFNDYKNALLKALAAGAAKDKLRQALTDGEQMYRDYRREFDKEVKEIEKDDAKNGKIGVSRNNAEPVDPALAKKDQDMRASNKVYAARVAKIDALRTRREEILTAVRESKEKLPTEAQKAALDELTNQIRAQQALALQAASEAYNSEGAMVDVVVNQQMFKKDDASKVVTTLNEKLQSVNEQFGDVFKELAHGGSEAVAAAKASKYAYRFARMADEAIKALPENLKPKQSAFVVEVLLKLNAEGGELQNMRQSATPKAAGDLFQKFGLKPEGYKGLFIPVNIELNSALRAAIELEESKAKNGGGSSGAAPKTA